MKRTKDGYRAHELETIVAPESGDYANKCFYVVDGQPGLYRRLTAKDAKVMTDGVLSVWFDGGIIPVVRVQAVEKELQEAGFKHDTLGCLTIPRIEGTHITNRPIVIGPHQPYSSFPNPVVTDNTFRVPLDPQFSNHSSGSSDEVGGCL
jgi:hypothetical protein